MTFFEVKRSRSHNAETRNVSQLHSFEKYGAYGGKHSKVKGERSRVVRTDKAQVMKCIVTDK